MEKTCPKCKAKFYDKDAKYSYRARTFCSRDCANKTTMNGLKLKGISQDTTHLKSYQFEKGKQPWNKGVKGYKLDTTWLTPERRKAIGKRVSESQRGKHRPDKQGANSNFWKGGVSGERDRIHQSAEYREWRRQVFERDDYTCQMCGIKGSYLEADHIKPFSTHIDLRFELSNGRTLCKSCHRQTPTYGGRMNSVKQMQELIKSL